MFELTPELREEIARDLRKTRAAARTAKNLGIGIRFVLEVVEAEKQPRPFREEKYGGMGRPELQKYIVDRKRPWEVWNNAVDPVLAARTAYESGTHEMTTGRDGDWLILYSIPRLKTDTTRASYFLPENM